jgi:hypothetical protein
MSATARSIGSSTRRFGGAVGAADRAVIVGDEADLGRAEPDEVRRIVRRRGQHAVEYDAVLVEHIGVAQEPRQLLHCLRIGR